jgi:hypothetical protein
MYSLQMRQKLIRLFTQVLLDDNIMNNDIEKFNLPRENDGRGFTNLEILQHNQIASLKNYSLNRARDNTFLMLWFQPIKVIHILLVTP